MRGRPIKYTKKRINEIKRILEIYIIETDIPIIAEFAYKNHIPRQKLYEFKELNDTIKELIDKKEANLERMALEGEIEKTMAIFSLKQLGWSDKIDHNLNIQGELLNQIKDLFFK